MGAAEFRSNSRERALRLKFVLAGALRKRFVEKSIFVSSDRLCRLRFTRVADIALDMIALQFANGARRRIGSRRSCAKLSDREEFARPTPRFFCEILLAAFLIMCNAAENFFAAEMEILRKMQGYAVKSRYSVARCAERHKDSLPGFSRRSNRPLQLERALCLLL